MKQILSKQNTIIFIAISVIILLAILKLNVAIQITSEGAIEKVKNLSEVQDYLKRVPNGIIKVDDELDGEYNVHVYEIKNGHTATFNWYNVDKTTGAVKKQF